MVGETVVVETRSAVGTDNYKSPIYETSESEVSNVLVAPADTDDVFGNTRPDGAQIKYTLYFPKTFDGDLEGCRIKVRDEWLSVIGHPDHFDKKVCPTKWWMVVRVGGIHG